MLKLLPFVLSFTLLVGGGASVALSTDSGAKADSNSKIISAAMLQNSISPNQHGDSDLFLSATRN